nr:hypothetical protein [Tanacetum cinerariifolium]
MLPVAPPSPYYIPGLEEPQTPPAPQDEDEYDGLPMLPVAPPSPYYIPGLEVPQTPPAPQDEDKHELMFIQPHDLDFVPKPIYPEYIPLEDEHILSAEEQSLPHVVLPIAESPGLLAMPTPSPSPLTSLSPPSAEERLARWVKRLLAMPTPSPSPLTSLSPPSAEERLARCSSYEVGESSAWGRGANYGFADTVEAKIRH